MEAAPTEAAGKSSPTPEVTRRDGHHGHRRLGRQYLLRHPQAKWSSLYAALTKMRSETNI
jgi:hypothetical protein